MKIEKAIERISETENLTDALEDDDANWLLEWGFDRLPGLIGSAPTDQEAEKKLTQLMGVMRKVNTITGEREFLTEEDLEKEIHNLAEDYRKTFGKGRKPLPADDRKLANEVKQQPPRQAMQALLGKLET
jgi:hypothetical protein